MTRGGPKVGKSELLQLARALGESDEEIEELSAETMWRIFHHCLDRAEQLAAPARLFDGRPTHPRVRQWCASVMDHVDEVQKERPADDEKWLWYSAFSLVRGNSGRPCEHRFDPGSHICGRMGCAAHIDEVFVDESCSHKFVDSSACLLCRVSANVLKAKHRRELEQLGAANVACAPFALDRVLALPPDSERP